LSSAEGIARFYPGRDQRTSVSAIRPQDCRRLRSSARAAAARRFGLTDWRP
jgi:hypothetical protein